MSQTSCPTCGILNGPISFSEAPTSLRVLDLLSTNIPPHDADVADLRQIVENTSAVVQSLQGHIDKVQATLSALQSMHDTASRRLADAKCILHPIRSLPRDILSEILSCTPIADETRNEAFEHGPEFDTLCPRNHPWNLSHVCHSWREAALCLPRLWSTVFLNFERYKKLSYRQCVFESTLLFERSANLDLSIMLASGQDGIVHHPMMGCIEASTARWRTLHCRIPISSLQALSGSKFSLLQELGFSYCYERNHGAALDIFKHVPNIRTVAFYHSDYAVDSYTALDAFPWSNVKNLTCYTFFFLSSLQSILEEATNIEELTLSPMVIQLDFIIKEVSLPALQQLNLTKGQDADAECIATILGKLRVPAIRRLELTFFPGQYVGFRTLDSHPDLHRITSLRVTCSLAAPRGEDDAGSGSGDEMLLKLLRLTTGVEDFHLVDNHVSVDFLRAFILDGTEAEAVVLPSLRSLDLRGCDSAAYGEVLNLPLLLLAESRFKSTDATDIENRPSHTLERMVLPSSWNPFECSPDDERRNRWAAVNIWLKIVCI